MREPIFDTYSLFFHADRAHRSPLPEPNAMIRIARVIAALIMLLLWIAVVLPVWLALLLRTILAFSVATIISLFSGKTPPDSQRLDTISALWPSGFSRIILSIRQPEGSYKEPQPIDPHIAVMETILAIIFYSGLYVASIYVWSAIYTKLHDFIYDALNHFFPAL